MPEVASELNPLNFKIEEKELKMTIFKNSKFIIALSALSTLIGCEEQVKTVEWYKAHEKERKEKIMNCNSEFKDDYDCKNAREAAMLAIDEKFKK